MTITIYLTDAFFLHEQCRAEFPHHVGDYTIVNVNGDVSYRATTLFLDAAQFERLCEMIQEDGRSIDGAGLVGKDGCIDYRTSLTSEGKWLPKWATR